MKKIYLIIIAIVVVVVLTLGVIFWRKTFCCVAEQEGLISCAEDLYKQNKLLMNFSSQCLGVCENYAVDIVHVPRIAEDNLPENQCEAYRQEEVNHFIELNKNGEIVRIV